MPSKKGKRMASRQAQLAQRSRRKGVVASPHLSEAQLKGPTTDDTPVSDSIETTKGLPENTVPEPPLNPNPPVQTRGGNAASQSVSPRARREQVAIATQSGPRLRSELLRIGIVMTLVVATLMGLNFGLELGA